MCSGRDAEPATNLRDEGLGCFVVRSAVPSLGEACRAGDRAGAERALAALEDPDVRRLVTQIGGPRAMVRFLLQRGHVLRPDGGSVAAWLRAHLEEAEPMHLLDVGPALAAAREAGHAAIVYRLEEHLRFVQPPDPTRWSRKLPTPAGARLLAAARVGDLEGVTGALELEPGLVTAVDRWGADALVLAASSGENAPALIAALFDAGAHGSVDAVVAAARSADPACLEVLLERGAPVRGKLDRDALWSLAEATGPASSAEPRPSPSRVEATAARLLAAGAEPNVADRWGRTAWGVADEPTRALLVRLGAAPTVTVPGRYERSTGLTQRVSARLGGDAAAPAGAPANAGGRGEAARPELDLNEAAALGDLATVRRRLDMEYRLTPVVQGAGSPERPLHLAAHFGHRELAQVLVSEYGYSPGEVNRPLAADAFVGPPATWGQTALLVAAAAGQAGVVEVLMNSVDYFQGRRARRK